MDFFLQAMNSAPKRVPPQDKASFDTSRQQNYQSRRPPPAPIENPNFNGGFQSNNPRYPQASRPQPPPIMTPPVHPNNMRLPPPPQSKPRQNEYQQPQERNFQRSQGRPQRGRSYNQRNYRESSPQNHYEDYQPNYQSQGYEETNRNRRGYQNDHNQRNNRQRNYQQREDHQRYQRPQDNRGYYNKQRDYQGQERQREGDQRMGDHRINKYDRQPIHNQRERMDNRYNRNFNRQQQTQRGGQRGRPRGRDRGRGRGRGRNQPQQKAQVQRSESESKSMPIESQEAVQSEHQQQSEQISEEQSESQQIEENSSEEMEESGNHEMVSDSGQGGKLPSISESGSIAITRIDSMVSKEEFEERNQTFRMNNRGGGLRLDTGRSFAIFEINKRTMQPDLSLTLKRFRRSTNRGQSEEEKDETADCPRSVKGLHTTIKHIHKEIIDSDGLKPKDLAFPLPPGESKIEFLHIYDFLWNRMREMIKDVARLDIKERGTKEIVTICEQMLRFFIIAIREGRLPHRCKLGFDSKMNLESITKILTQLLQIYEMTHYKMDSSSSRVYISPNQPQILGYAILISNDLQRTLNQKLRIKLSGEGLEHPLLNSPEVQTALTIKKALKIRDYTSFYKMLQSRQIDYLQSCLLIHNLPSVRREVLRVFQKSCPIDKDTKIKTISASFLAKVLGFSPNLMSQYRQFLENANIQTTYQNGEQLGLLTEINESLEDFTESYAFDFGFNKKDRSLYSQSQIKRGMIDQNSISRQELIKRTHHYGNYLKQCSQFYDNATVFQQIKYPQIPKQIKEVQKQQIQKVPEKSVKSEEALGKLQKMKKLLERTRFLQGLQKLITNLVKRSDVHSQHQRKRGATLMIQFMEIQKEAILKISILRLKEYSECHRLTYQTIENLNQFATNRKRFIDSFFMGTSEFKEFNSTKNYRPLAQAVQPRPKIAQGIMTQLLSLVQNNKKSSKISLLVLFSSSTQNPLSSLQIKVLKNIYNYLTSESHYLNTKIDPKFESLCSSLSKKPYLDLHKQLRSFNGQLDIKIRFHHYRSEEEEKPNIFGFDSIIVLDLHGNKQPFTKLIQSFKTYRKKVITEIIGKHIPLRTDIIMLLVIPTENFKQKIIEGDSKEQQESLWHIAENQSIRLSLLLRHNLLQIISNNLQDNNSESLQLEPVTLTNLLNQIYQNMQFAENMHSNTSSLQFFEVYFKANFNFLKKVFTQIVQKYEIYDWTNVILESNYLKKPAQETTLITEEVTYPQEKIDWNALLSSKLLFMHNILSELNSINLLSRFNAVKKERPYSSPNQLLAAAVEQYLQLFEKEERPDSLELICEYVIENSCSLTFKDGAIQGDARALVSYIIVQLKKLLKYLTVVLPKGFRFKLNKKDLNVAHKAEVKENPSSLSSHQPLLKMEYQHKTMLEQLMAEVGEEFKNLRSEGQKMIKI